MAKILSGKQIVDKEFISVEGISQRMKDSIGDIEDTFSCCIWGDSSNGKTSFTLELVANLQVLGDVLYLGYEEGHGKSFKKGLERSSVDLNKISVVDHCEFDELVEILNRRFSAKIVVIDSIQYSDFTLKNYKLLKRQFMFGRAKNARKIFIFISHATGKKPDGTVAGKIAYDANVKVYVKNFIAFVGSRFGTKQNYVIYEAGARDRWGDKYDDVTCVIGTKKTKKTIKKPKAKTNAKAIPTATPNEPNA
ncbi:hypothetical protein ACFOWM_06115 [Ferruginibacter yonginensis]|uniref:AAA+ ATPase domain-containing protein n=1 Tax=Ferruginibacter yonginensis TaxID=1310416 RepID=A0ABV8QQG8_9BACT